MRLGSAALATGRVERRLAAILAADVAGYSRLIGADEEGTLARLRVHRRELIDLRISEHRGRVPLGHTVLQFGGKTQGVDHASEFDQNSVAGGLNDD